MLIDFAILLAGLVLLIVGGDVLVRGAAGLAKALGVSSLIIGLTVVAFGTSAPELAVNVMAAIRGRGDISFGNIIGSNIANVGLILGLAALARPVVVQWQVIVREIPFMLLVTACTINLGLDNLWWGSEWGFDVNDGITLLMLFSIFLYYSATTALEQREEAERLAELPGPATSSIAWLSFMTVLGIVMVGAGGELTVQGAERVALALGVGREIIGLTIIAFGTSLPELATSLAAAIRKHEDIAIGNIVGSNVFNLLFIMGTTSVIGYVPVPEHGLIDLLAAFAFSAVLFPMCVSNQKRITRVEGAVLLIAYCSYIYYRAFYLGGLSAHFY